jgi:cation transport regulator ChaB
MKLDDGTMQEGYLRRLTLREVSGCGRGMNPLARVLLLKADGSPGVTKIFKTTAELPKAVRDVLPAEAQATFLKVANAALAKAPDDDEAALKQAWAAVKSAWAKGGDGKWVKKAKKPDDPEDDDKDGKNGKKKPPPWMTAKLVDRVAKAFYGYGSPASDGGTAAVGARSFDDLIDEREAQQEQDEVNQELWPLFSALE